MDHNNLSHYVFEFLGQNWSPGVKKWPFWAKIGYTKKLIFLKNTSSNFVHIAHKDTFWVNNNDEKMIGAAPRQKNFRTAIFPNFGTGTCPLAEIDPGAQNCPGRPQTTLKYFPGV